MLCPRSDRPNPKVRSPKICYLTYYILGHLCLAFSWHATSFQAPAAEWRAWVVTHMESVSVIERLGALIQAQAPKAQAPMNRTRSPFTVQASGLVGYAFRSPYLTNSLLPVIASVTRQDLITFLCIKKSINHAFLKDILCLSFYAFPSSVADLCTWTTFFKRDRRPAVSFF